jgi:hypothetical protein
VKLSGISGKKEEYLKNKINELATYSRKKNIRDLYIEINEFKRGYKPRSNLVKDEIGDLDSHNILKRWKNCFSQLFSMHKVSNVRQMEVYQTESLVPESSSFEV